MKRNKPLRRVNRARLAKRRAEQFGPQSELCKKLPCCVCGVEPSEPHHVRSRGAGGKDLGNVVPLCPRVHHPLVHSMGTRSFEGHYRVNLKDKTLAAVAAELAKRIEETECL